MADRDWVLQAGQHDAAILASSLVPPAAKVAVGLGAPLGLQTHLEARGCQVVSSDQATLWVGGLGDVVAGMPGVLTAPNRDHGAVQVGMPAPPGALTAVERAAAVEATGFPVLARTRTFAPFDAAGAGAALQADPTNWIDWEATLVGPASLAPPPPLPDHIPERSVLVLAEAPFGAWDLPRRRMLLALDDVVRSHGHTLVLSWSDERLTGSLAAHVDLRRHGIVLHGGDRVFDPEGTLASVVDPGTRALVSAYTPTVVIVLDTVCDDIALAIAAAELPEATMFGVDFEGPTVEAGVPLALVPTRVAEELAAEPAPSPGRIAVIQPRPRQAGVTSVVIPVHGRWDLTSACLESLRRNTRVPTEIIVVDNASPDETPRRLAEQPDVTTITCATNLGFAGGTNVGLQAATGEYVCLLNNDTEVMPGWLERLQAALAVEGAGIVGPRSNSISGLQVLLDGPSMQDLPAARAWGEEQARAGGDRSWRIQRLVGFAMLLRGDLLEELGGLDEAVGLGNYEDDDLCQRVRRRGLHLRVADGSVVMHHGSATFVEADINALTTARQGARHLGDRLAASSDLVVARVVADATPDLVEAVVSTARLVADEQVIVCNGPTLPWAVRTSYVNRRAVRTVSGDPDQLRIPTSAPWVLHLRGRTALDHNDWGTARAAIEALPRTAHAIAGIPGGVLEPVVDGFAGPAPDAEGLPITDVLRPASRPGT